jgi:anti-sigma factor RsiW
MYRWLDGNLPESLRVSFERHLDTCSDCRCTAARWAQLETDVIAAAALFGGCPLADAMLSDDDQPTEAGVIATLEPASPPAGPNDRKRYRRFLSISQVVGWVTAASVIFAVAIGWKLTLRTSLESDIAHVADGRTAGIAANSGIAVGPQVREAPMVPDFKVSIRAPVIATKSVTTPRFTVVNVYPIFRPMETLVGESSEN